MDQALDSKYNKPAKVTLGIIAWTGKNEAVYKWNLMKYEKSSYTNLFCEISGINKEHEYFLHHEFSEQPTEVDKRCVSQLDSYIQERGNPFDIKEDATKNLETGTTLSDEATSFFLKCFTKGKENYDKFTKERLQDKKTKLFDAIPKTSSTMQKGKIWGAPDEKKESQFFSCHWLFKVKRVWCVVSTIIRNCEHFVLSDKDGSLQKSTNSELAREVKNLFGESCPATVPESDERLKTIK